MDTARERALEAGGANKVYDTWWLDETLKNSIEAASDVWEELLRKYGHHLPGCSINKWPYNSCDCGLKEALGD